MLLKISKTNDIEKDNPFFDFSLLTSTLDKSIFKPISLIYDTQSPFRYLSQDDKVSRINEYLGISDTSNYIDNEMYNDEIESYLSLCPSDPIESTLTALTEQSNKIALEIKSANISIGDSDAKEFERFMKWSIEVLDTTKTILYLRGLKSNIQQVEKQVKKGDEFKTDTKNNSDFLISKALKRNKNNVE